MLDLIESLGIWRPGQDFCHFCSEAANIVLLKEFLQHCPTDNTVKKNLAMKGCIGARRLYSGLRNGAKG